MRNPLAFVLSSLALGCLAAPGWADDPSAAQPVSAAAYAPAVTAMPTPATLKQTTTPPACDTGHADCNSDWSGFYIGANAGWAQSNFLDEIGPAGRTAIADFGTQSLHHRADGPVIGAQIGYNWQIENFVIGLEGDFDFSNLSGNGQSLARSQLNRGTSLNGFMTTDTINWFTSIRGRAGYAFGSGLLYATAGAGWENLSRSTLVNAEVAPSVFGVTAVSNVTSVRPGYVLGGGYEYLLSSNWTVRGEYLYYNFSVSNTDSAPFSIQATPNNAALTKVGHNEIHEIRIGINYKF